MAPVDIMAVQTVYLPGHALLWTLLQISIRVIPCQHMKMSLHRNVVSYMGLLLAVEHVAQNPVDTIIITDSEYLFNTMTKRWVDRWIHENWLTAKGTKVKNQDLWRQIWSYYILHEDIISFYHIKGHLLSVGDKKCHEIMQHDVSGHELYKWAYMHREIPDNKRQHAIALFTENNGFTPDEVLLQHFAAMNLVADTIANLCVEKVESKRWQSILSTDVPTL